ncbi:MAG: hypothetical protein D4R67_07720 [Bacteroidetes bacterium]|nr:MAG: hypothetical protein D4R67_07720 [Bacteroidota bacterium]
MFDNAPRHPLSLLFKQPNFRDIGGISTEDGHVVKRGLLFRSGDLSRITPEDIKHMVAWVLFYNTSLRITVRP